MIESSVRIHRASSRELSVGARQRLVGSELPFGSCAQNGFFLKAQRVASVTRRHIDQMCVRLVAARGE